MTTTAMRAYDDWYPYSLHLNDKPAFSQWEAAWERNETPPQRMHLFARYGHGHVYAQDRVARCGGPGVCMECYQEYVLVRHAMKVGYYLGGKALAQSFAIGPAKYVPPASFKSVYCDPVMDVGGKHFKVGNESNEVMPDPRLEKLVKNIALMQTPPVTEAELDAWVKDQAEIIRSLVRSEIRPPQGVHLQLTANSVDMSKAMLSAATQMQDAVNAFVKSMSQVTIPVDLQATERKDHD